MAIRTAPFQVIFLRLLSLNEVAFCRRVISSNCGWRHVPGDGVSTGSCWGGCVLGVEGREDVVNERELMLLVRYTTGEALRSFVLMKISRGKD